MRPTYDAVLAAVRRMAVRESRLSIEPDGIAPDEPLNGRLLRVTSVGMLGMLVRLEEDLDVTLPDDLFAGRRITTVADLVDLIATVGTPR